MDLGVAMEGKAGFFEWVVPLPVVRRYLDVAIPHCQTSREKEKSLRLIEIGGGTSTLSEEVLSNCAAISSVVSVDNDVGCVAHMRESFPKSSVRYLVHDMVTGPSPSMIQATAEWKQSREAGEEILHATTDLTEEPAIELVEDGYFDLVVDKGTFDAILTVGDEGSMLHEVNRLLDCGGVYLVFSIHKLHLLVDLISIPQLNMTVLHQQSFECSGQDVSVVIARKNSQSLSSVDEIRQATKRVVDAVFKDEEPFLTSELRSTIDKAYEKVVTEKETDIPSALLTLRQVHKLCFLDTEMLDYEFEMFLDDLEDFPHQHENGLLKHELIAFLEDMQ